jgi:hypothetical protein
MLPQSEFVGVIVIGVITLIPFAGALLGIGLWVGGVARTATTAASEAAALRERVHDLSNALATFKETAARECVSRDALDRLEERLMSGIEKLGERLDRILQPQPPN